MSVSSLSYHYVAKSLLFNLEFSDVALSCAFLRYKFFFFLTDVTPQSLRSVVKRRKLFEDLLRIKQSIETYECVVRKYDPGHCSKDALREIKKKLSAFRCDFDKRWMQCSGKKDCFLTK